MGGEGRGSAKCAGEESPKKEGTPTNESPSLFGSLFKRSPSPEPKCEDYPDLDACAGFKKELDKVWDFSLIKSKRVFRVISMHTTKR